MNPYEPILKEVASGMLETAEKRQKFSNDAFMDATLIFQTVLMDKVFEIQEYDKMEIRYRLEMAESCGNDLRKLIHTYTGLDTVKLIDNYEE
jgi:hypothetical protein